MTFTNAFMQHGDVLAQPGHAASPAATRREHGVTLTLTAR